MRGQLEASLTSPEVQPEVTDFKGLMWFRQNIHFLPPRSRRRQKKAMLHTEWFILTGPCSSNFIIIAHLFWCLHYHCTGFQDKKKYLHRHRTCCNPLKQFLFLLKFFDVLTAKRFILLTASTIYNTNNNKIFWVTTKYSYMKTNEKTVTTELIMYSFRSRSRHLLSKLRRNCRLCVI